jgi:hypothetical protein
VGTKNLANAGESMISAVTCFSFSPTRARCLAFQSNRGMAISGRCQKKKRPCRDPHTQWPGPRIMARTGGKPKSAASSTFLCSEYGKLEVQGQQGESLVEVITRYALQKDGSVEGRKRVAVFKALGGTFVQAKGGEVAAYDYDLSLTVSSIVVQTPTHLPLHSCPRISMMHESTYLFASRLGVIATIRLPERFQSACQYSTSLIL